MKEKKLNIAKGEKYYDSTQLNSTQLNSTQLNSTQLNEWFARLFDCWVWKCEQCGKENIIQGELTTSIEYKNHKQNCNT